MQRIVYPDAGANFIELLTDDLTVPLRRFSKLTVFEGRPETKEQYIERIKDADGLILSWGIDNDVLQECDKLKAIAFLGYGVKNFVDFEFTRNNHIAVMNTPGYGDNAVAEHALTLLLSLTKNIPQNNQTVKQGMWDAMDTSIEVKGKTIGLIGMGGIGIRMANLCKGLGMNVICWTFNPSEQRARELGITFVELNQLLSQSDFVSLHLPYTEKTEYFLGERELSLMKEGSLLINTARAELIDTTALVEQLQNGKIKGAGFDVFDEEPVAKDNPLLTLDNVILSPHVGYNTPDAIRNILKISVDNLANYFNGKPQNITNGVWVGCG